jgi:hypothetical protein
MQRRVMLFSATMLAVAMGCGGADADADKPIPPTPTIDQFQGGTTGSAVETPPDATAQP